MSWTTDIDVQKLKHVSRVVDAFRSFALGRTARLVDLSQWQPNASRFGLSHALFLIASAAMLGASALFYVYEEGRLGFLEWSAAFTALFALILIVPSLIGYRLLKVRRSNFLLNIILIQQTLIAVAALVSYLLLISQQPARTDFVAFQQGRGEGTVAHRYFCGGLELTSEMAYLNERAMARSRSAMERTRETLSWGPPNMRDAPQRVPVILAGMDRMREEMREMDADSIRVEQINESRLASAEAFDSTYPTYRLALALFSVLVLLLLLGSLFHLVRATLLGDRGKRWLPKISAAAIITWAFAGAFVWALAGTSPYLDYSEVDVQTPQNLSPEDLMANRREVFARLEAQANINAERTAQERAKVRAAILSMRSVCPSINTHGVV